MEPCKGMISAGTPFRAKCRAASDTYFVATRGATPRGSGFAARGRATMTRQRPIPRSSGSYRSTGSSRSTSSPTMPTAAAPCST